MAETSPTFEVQPPSPPSPLEAKPAAPLSTETQPPRTATFGTIEVREDRTADLLSPHEKVLYKGGFEIFKEVVAAADNNIVRMVLTTPDVVSGVVGLQPLVSMDSAQAGIVYQSFEDAGIDFTQDFSLLEFGKERDYLKILVNDRAAENVLRNNQTVLGLTLPDRPLQKAEIMNYTLHLLNGSDTKRANLAHGLLSGFPLEDCQRWINSGEATLTSIPPLKQIAYVKSRFGTTTTEMPDGKQVTGRPRLISWLHVQDYSLEGSRNHFLPDTRSTFSSETHSGIVEGFGLRWAAPIPPQEATVRHAQRLLQIDRELGLLDYVSQQRSTFSIEDNARAIAIEKQLSGSASTTATPSGKIKGAAALAFGILASFASEITKEVAETPRR